MSLRATFKLKLITTLDTFFCYWLQHTDFGINLTTSSSPSGRHLLLVQAHDESL